MRAVGKATTLTDWCVRRLRWKDVRLSIGSLDRPLLFSNLESNPFPTGKSRETAITGGHCQTFWFVDQTRCYWCAQVQVTCCIPHFISNLSKNAAPHDNIGKPLIMQTFGCCVITRTVDGLTKECIPLFTLNAVKTENAILIGGGFSLYTYRETCVPYQCKGEHVTFTPRLGPVLIEKKTKRFSSNEGGNLFYIRLF